MPISLTTSCEHVIDRIKEAHVCIESRKVCFGRKQETQAPNTSEIPVLS